MCLAACLLIVLCASTRACAAAPSGSRIVNRAQAYGHADGQPFRVESNLVSDLIVEVLDVTLAAEAPASTRLESRTDAQPIPILLHNAGNGREAFLISASTTGRGARLRSLALDVNDNGRFDPAIDTSIGPNAPTPLLEPGGTLRLFAVLDGAEEGDDGLTIDAQATTGTGPPGRLFAANDEGDGDAIAGTTRAMAQATLALVISGPPVSLVKSQHILGAGGTPVRGATIRYTIEARLSPGATVADARIVDPVPAGTRYVPGSLTLDGTILSDAADGDAGLIRDDEIQVALGTLSVPSRTVTFDVTIN